MKRRTPPPPGPAVNITSLCDIMLSLLIFFMLVSKAGVDTGADPDLALPTATLGITEDQFEQEQSAGAPAVINVRPVGNLPGQPRVYGSLFTTGEEFDVGVDELEEFLKKLRGDREDFEVFVHAARDTPFYDMEPVQRAVSRSNAAGVQYAFQQPQ